MDRDRCGSGVRWCDRAEAMFNADGMHVLDAQRGYPQLVITVESDAAVTGCPCGVIWLGHGRRRVKQQTRRVSGCRAALVTHARLAVRL